MRLLELLALSDLATFTGARPAASPIPRFLPRGQLITARQDKSTHPCAQASQVIYKNPEKSPYLTNIPAKIAWDCINSIPLNVSSARRLVRELPLYLDWQSTLTALKNPPAEYVEKVQPAVDIIGGLKQIGSDLDAGKFTSEYDFGWTLYTLILAAHDGHLLYVPDSVGAIFTWGRPVPLVSVSADGEQLPSIFAFEDVLGLQFKNISYTPSPVVEIDGVDATEFLEDWAQLGGLHDRDALYNNNFYELAQVTLGGQGAATGMFAGGGRARWAYPGPTTTLKFANGSTYTMENYARLQSSNFRNINTGEDVAERFFNYGGQVQAEVQDDQEPAAEPALAPGYPAPVVAGPTGLINGFYISAPGYEDVAVLQIPSFVSSSAYSVDFQKAAQRFLPQALADGKTKLIIDVQANGGGTILQGYDIFKQLFPGLDPYGASRFRYTEAADLIGQAYSAFASQFPRPSGNASVRSIQASYFDSHQDMTVDGKPWGSWKQKVGPVEVNGDKYTSLTRWNLSDAYTNVSSGGIWVTGYGPLANVTEAPLFKPENIVLVTDGYCASTCSIFSEFLTKQAGVKTIALGGRSNRNPIQAVGGVKGVNNYGFQVIDVLAQNALMVAPSDLKAQLDSSVLKNYGFNNIVALRTRTSSAVNVRDGLSLDDDSGVALQFVYEEADCRLFYTPEMTVDATAIWKAAADAKWGDNGKCVTDYEQKRAVHDVTTKLSSGSMHVSEATALHQFEAFESTLGLETNCQVESEGFMQP